MEQYHISPSGLKAWTRCELSAWDEYWNEKERPPRPMRIGTWIGRAVHRMVLEDEEDELPEKPKFSGIVFDAETPNWAQAETQSRRMAFRIRKLLETYPGMEVLDREVEIEPWSLEGWSSNVTMRSRMDLLVYMDGRHGIIDIKTDPTPGSHRLQLAAYAMGHLMQAKLFWQDLFIGILHCPRKCGYEDDTYPQMHFQEMTGEMVEILKSTTLRINDLLRDDSRITASPGHHCRRCRHETCSFREKEYKSR